MLTKVYTRDTHRSSVVTRQTVFNEFYSTA